MVDHQIRTEKGPKIEIVYPRAHSWKVSGGLRKSFLKADIISPPFPPRFNDGYHKKNSNSKEIDKESTFEGLPFE